jgi:aminoglycoside/choline kinase family phosphotransferase
MKTLLPPWIERCELAGDVSTRIYERLRDASGMTAILVTYPPPLRGAIEPHLRVRSWCEDRGLPVPRLLDCDVGEGWALVEDFGSDDASAQLAHCAPERRFELLQAALGPLRTLAAVPVAEAPAWNPPLDGRRLRWELAGFELWFIRHRCGLRPVPEVGEWLDQLARTIDAHPRRPCHRDYHLNNIFILEDGRVGLIDYQDLTTGPDTYDAVSLVGERETPQILGQGIVDGLREAWAESTGAAPGWRDRWPWVRAQRGLKAIGTFSRLGAADRPEYHRWLRSLCLNLQSDLRRLGAPEVLREALFLAGAGRS